MSETQELLKSALELRYGQSLPGTDWADEARLLLGVLAIPKVKLIPREPTEAMKSCSDEIHWGYSCHVCGGLQEGWRLMWDAA